MKISIMSMQDINNFGSLLQAYALKKILSEYGEVSFLPIRQLEEDRLVQFEPVIYSKEFERSNGLVDKIRKIDRYVINRLKNREDIKKQNLLFEEFRQKYFKRNIGHQIDTCVIGSDEVFNCLQVSPWGYASRLFGNVEEADKVISYAASCGYTTAEQCSEDLCIHLRKAMDNFAAISVRDSNSELFVRKITGKNAELHLDPVLIGDFSDEIKLAQKNLRLPDKFCIIYAYNNRFNKKEEIRAILDFCRERRCVPVTIGAPQAWINGMLCLSPFQALAAFSQAAFVITDTFHGTIMAAKYCGKFAVCSRESNANKLNDLVKRLNLEKHLIHSWNQLEVCAEADDSRNIIKQITDRERKKSKAYFDVAL